VDQFETGTAQDAERYATLARSFVNGEISPLQFEDAYLALFRNETKYIPEEFASPINEIFYDVDAYVADPALRDDGDLDDEQLKERVAASMERLQNALSGKNQ
jgi:hypothetical protein